VPIRGREFHSEHVRYLPPRERCAAQEFGKEPHLTTQVLAATSFGRMGHDPRRISRSRKDRNCATRLCVTVSGGSDGEQEVSRAIDDTRERGMSSDAPTMLVVPDRADTAAVETGDAAGALEFARGAHLNFQGMVTLADQKAGVLVAGTGLITALLGSNLIDRFHANPCWALICAGALTMVLLLGVALCAMLVLVPRCPDERDVAPVVAGPGLMWGISRFHQRPADYVRALLTLTPAEAVADLAHENLKITWILERKWKWMKWATRLSCGALLTWAATVVLAAFGG
jgi:hypothetical protein